MVGSAIGGLIGWSDAPPDAADMDSVRPLLEELGLPAGCSDEQIAEAVRAFQTHTGQEATGVADPRTTHLMVQYAKRARERRIGMDDDEDLVA